MRNRFGLHPPEFMTLISIDYCNSDLSHKGARSPFSGN
jgi:hypothetical protein